MAHQKPSGDLHTDKLSNAIATKLRINGIELANCGDTRQNNG
jgi:hypothetical protein